MVTELVTIVFGNDNNPGVVGHAANCTASGLARQALSSLPGTPLHSSSSWRARYSQDSTRMSVQVREHQPPVRDLAIGQHGRRAEWRDRPRR